MPSSEFSEFTYGYAVVAEGERRLARLGTPVTGAPVLPSLNKEKLVGYDAKLVTVTASYLLQFKVPYYVSRMHNRGCSTGHCTWSAWGRSHLRFEIDTSSDQHAVMLQYEKDISTGAFQGESLYVAPEYHTWPEHDSYHLASKVWEKSVAVSPSAFDPLPAGRHSYSYRSDVAKGWLMSEPREIQRTRLDQRLPAVAPDGPPDGVSLVEFSETVAFRRPDLRSALRPLDEDASSLVRYLEASAASHGAGLLLQGSVKEES